MNTLKYISCGLIAGAAIGSAVAFMKGSTPTKRRKIKKNYDTATQAVSEIINGVRSSMK